MATAPRGDQRASLGSGAQRMRHVLRRFARQSLLHRRLLSHQMRLALRRCVSQGVLCCGLKQRIDLSRNQPIDHETGTQRQTRPVWAAVPDATNGPPSVKQASNSVPRSLLILAQRDSSQQKKKVFLLGRGRDTGGRRAPGQCSRPEHRGHRALGSLSSCTLLGGFP